MVTELAVYVYSLTIKLWEFSKVVGGKKEEECKESFTDSQKVLEELSYNLFFPDLNT